MLVCVIPSRKVFHVYCCSPQWGFYFIVKIVSSILKWPQKRDRKSLEFSKRSLLRSGNSKWSEESKWQLDKGKTSSQIKSWTGETEKGNNQRHRESIWRWASQTRHSPAREGQSIRASCLSEGTVNKPHRQVLQPPVMCLRPPRLKRGWGWLILTGFMWAGAEGSGGDGDV